MRHELLAIILMLLGLSACSNQDSTMIDNSEASDQKHSESVVVTDAKTLVDNNTFIDIDIDAYDMLIAASIDHNNFNESVKQAQNKYPEQTAMANAALYRYYSKLSVVDGYFVCSAKKASDLNMSERTFRAFDDNIKRLNEDARIERAKGNEMTFPRITQDYLESLLK